MKSIYLDFGGYRPFPICLMQTVSPPVMPQPEPEDFPGEYNLSRESEGCGDGPAPIGCRHDVHWNRERSIAH